MDPRNSRTLQPQESIYTKRNLPIIPPIVRNYNTFFFGIRAPDTSGSPRTFIQSQNIFSGVTGKFVTYQPKRFIQ